MKISKANTSPEGGGEIPTEMVLDKQKMYCNLIFLKKHVRVHILHNN